MKKYYMDYGVIQSESTRTPPYPPHKEIDYKKNLQTYNLTHNGEGQSLSFLDKAFISFTYGGKKIEDFNLIAITINDRLDREMAPAHEDYTTNYSMLNGQYYWGTHYNAREMTIDLATDGMEQIDLDNFKSWFRAGEIRELILSQHPNRGIMARIAESPQISVLPFKKSKRVLLNEEYHDITIIEYKGNIQLHFIMDEPFWYSINNILGQLQSDDNGYMRLINKWHNADGEEIEGLDADGYKVAIEDHIPTGDMIDDEINISDSIKIIPDNKYKYTLTTKMIEGNENGMPVAGTPVVNEAVTNSAITNQALVDTAIIDDAGFYETGRYPYSGAIAGPIYYTLNSNNNILTQLNNNWFLKNMGINSDGDLQYNKSYENSWVTLNYIPAKAGSTIKLVTNNQLIIRVSFYDATTKEYIQTKLLSADYTFQKDYYIRLYIVYNNEGQININDYLNINIITFTGLGNTIQRPTFSSNITKLKEEWILFNSKLNIFDGVTREYDISYATVEEYLPVKAGSKIYVNNNIIVNLFIYDLINQKFKTTIQNIQGQFIIPNDCYIRLTIATQNLNIENINQKIVLDLYPQEQNNTVLNYYYAGTAPSYPTINFSIPIHFNDEGYIDSFNNQYVKTEEGQQYNTLTLESSDIHQLKITTPNIFTSYNKVINILKDENSLNINLSQLIQRFRLEISHYIIRDWIINCINIYQHSYNAQQYVNDNNKLMTLTSDMKKMLLQYMPYVFVEFKNANIIEKDDDPVSTYTPQYLEVQYSSATISRLNSNYELVTVPYENASSGIIDTIDFQLITSNALFFQWQFSTDGEEWFLMQQSENWTGATSSTLSCSKIGINDCRYYRCLVSNNDQYKYTTPIQILYRDPELKFKSYPTDVSMLLQQRATLIWQAENVETAQLYYQTPTSSRWTLFNDTSLSGYLKDPDFHIQAGQIIFSFTAINKSLNGYKFDVRISNKWKGNPVFATDYYLTYSGTKISILYLQMNTSLVVQYLQQDDTMWRTVDNTVKYIINGDHVRFTAKGIKNADSKLFYVQEIGTNEAIPIGNTLNGHPVTFSSTINESDNSLNYQITWQAQQGDENYIIYAKVEALNNQPISTNTKILPTVVSATDPNVAIKNLTGYVLTPNTTQLLSSDTISITAQESNYNVNYQWYFRKVGTSDWIALSNSDTKTLKITSLIAATSSNTDAGDYRVKIYRENFPDAGVYEQDNYFVTIDVKNRISINEQPHLANTSYMEILPQQEYYKDTNYEIVLYSRARYATTCTWYYQDTTNNTPVAFSSQYVTNSINTSGYLTSTVTIQQFRYSQLATRKFYCVWGNGYTNYTVTSNTVMQAVKKLDTTSINLTNTKSATFAWDWPRLVTSNQELTGTVTCTCSSIGTDLWQFEGMPLTQTIDGKQDGVYISGNSGHGGAWIVYNRNKRYYTEKQIASINLIDTGASEKITYLQLTPVLLETASAADLFGVQLYYKYYDSNGKAISNDLYTINSFNTPTIILYNELTDYNQIASIKFYVKPYYKRAWSVGQTNNDGAIRDSRNAPYVMGYSNSGADSYSLYTCFTSKCTAPMTGYKLKLTLRGKTIPYAAPRLLSATPKRLSQMALNLNTNNSQSEYLNDIIKINWYLPNTTVNYSSPEEATGISNVTITDIQAFSREIQQEVEKNAVYRFIYTTKSIYTGAGISASEGFYCDDRYYGLFVGRNDLGNFRGIPGLLIQYQLNEGETAIKEGAVIEIELKYLNYKNKYFSQIIPINFNCMLGEHNITYHYNKIKWPDATLDNLTSAKQICYLSSLRHNELYTKTESIGDMILYNNFIFTEQNHFDIETGRLKPWNVNDKTLCHKITYDGTTPLEELNINYKNYYL